MLFLDFSAAFDTVFYSIHIFIYGTTRRRLIRGAPSVIDLRKKKGLKQAGSRGR